MDTAIMWNIGQLVGLILLLKYMQVQVRDNKQAVEQVVKDSYTKAETNERIDLKLKPIEVGIEHLRSDLSEVKVLLGKLLDEKNK